MALDFSQVFQFKFGTAAFGAKAPRRLELSSLDGPSTAGGLLARQNMLLVPDDEGEGPPILVGWVDTGSKRSEIRSYRMLAKQFEARHGRRIDLEADAYAKLESELQGFFTLQDIELIRVDGPVGPAKSEREDDLPPKETGAGALVGMLVLGIALGFGLGYVVFAA